MEDMLLQFAQEGTILLAVCLWLVGVFLKKTPRVPDWLIPWLLLVIGVTGAVALQGPGMANVLQGILAAGLAVFADQLFKQTKNRESETKVSE